MPTQFIRIEGFGRKARGAPHRTASAMIAEIVREPQASQHIAIGGFASSRVIHGAEPEDLLTMALERAAAAKDRRGRALKSTSSFLFVAVASFPLSRTDRAADDGWAEEYERWSELNVAWASTYWHGCDLSIVEHTDEERRHQHIVIVPPLRTDGQLDVRQAHLGFGAVAKVIDRTTDRAQRKTRAFKAKQRTAYCAAMRTFQNDYQRAVAGRCGLGRLSSTPRHRMSRGAALIAQQQASRALGLNDRERKLIVERSNLERRQAMLRQMEADIAAERARLAAERERLERELSRTLAEANAERAQKELSENLDIELLVVEAPMPLKATIPKNDAGENLWAMARARLLDREFAGTSQARQVNAAPKEPLDEFDIAALVVEAPRPTKATRPKNDAGADVWAAARRRIEADSAHIQAQGSLTSAEPSPATYKPTQDEQDAAFRPR